MDNKDIINELKYQDKRFIDFLKMLYQVLNPIHDSLEEIRDEIDFFMGSISSIIEGHIEIKEDNNEQ